MLFYKGFFSFVNIDVENINVKDNAVICVSIYHSECRVNSCQCHYCSSGSGACFLWFLAKSAFVKNVCVSSLTPHYIGSTYIGGACLHLKETQQAEVCNIYIYKIYSTSTSVYATIGMYDNIATLQSINQTNCRCYRGNDYVCGFHFDNTTTIERYIKNIQMNGDFISHYVNQVSNSLAEKIGFYNSSARVSFLYYLRKSTNVLKTMSCVVMGCTGSIVNSNNAFVLNGWYCDQKLPSYFEKTVKHEIAIEINPAMCEGVVFNYKAQSAAPKITLSLLNILH